MASFNRRGTNLTSQFMREQLNAIRTNEPQEDFSALEPDNFELFTTTSFFDFDTGAQTDFKPDDSPPTSKPGQTSQPATQPTSATSIMGDYEPMEFLNPAAGRWLFSF